MDITLVLLMGTMAIVIILSLVVVTLAFPPVRKGWKLEVGKPEEIAPEMEVVEVDENQISKPKERVPGSVSILDITEGDSVFFETASGSQYRFTLKNARLSLYDVKGRSATTGKPCGGEIYFPGAFIPGRTVFFCSTENDWDCRTSRIVRLLVDKQAYTAISA